MKRITYLCYNKREIINNTKKLKDMNTAEKVNLLNEYCDYNDGSIYSFDENTINELFSNPWEIMKSAVFGEISMGHDYFTFNGNGNIETLSDWKIDDLFEDSDFQEWAIEEGHIESDED